LLPARGDCGTRASPRRLLEVTRGEEASAEGCVVGVAGGDERRDQRPYQLDLVLPSAWRNRWSRDARCHDGPFLALRTRRDRSDAGRPVGLAAGGQVPSYYGRTAKKREKPSGHRAQIVVLSPARG